MPICTIELLSLYSHISHFLQHLRQTPIKPLVLARVIRWIIKPTYQSKEALLDQNPPWDLLLIYEGSQSSFPSSIRNTIQARWSLQAGVPASIIASFKKNNERILHPPSDDIPKPMRTVSKPGGAASAQSLELDEELHQWITSGNDAPKGAVSMLNLLAFHPGKQAQYLQYGKAFAEQVGKRRGGLAKLVGKVIPGLGEGGCDGWDEVSLGLKQYVLWWGIWCAGWTLILCADGIGTLSERGALCGYACWGGLSEG
ncbi:MAG: hypothetical protein LQ343_006163 [Gyalolechia ehrenbergii]|nr:MAG: hypothetical protein LQ343_006163 [Gyalolechia ehrenbergii]